MSHTSKVILNCTWPSLLTEHLNDGNEAENLKESKPDKELLHGALLDSSIVEGGHLGTAEGLDDTGEESNVLHYHTSGSKPVIVCGVVWCVRFKMRN